MEFLISYFNSIKDRLTITLIDRLCSSGTMILEDFEGTIKFGDLDYILFHIADRHSLNFRNDECYDKKIIKAQDKEYNLKNAEKVKSKGFLTDKQLKDFLKGKDILIYRNTFSKWKMK